MLVMEEEGSASNRIAAIYAGALGILDKSSSVSETVGAIWKYIEMGAYNPAMKPEISETSTTGIPDTGRTMHRMKLEWALASRQASALTAVLIHLDRFDAIRKCMGQKIASQLLSQSFRAIEATLRTRDYLGSCSKNVFCAILPDLDIQQASEVVHRIRRQFRDTRFGDVDTPLSITLSIGACAVAKVDPKMSNQIVAHAEEEMQYLMARGGDAAIIRQYTSEDTDNRIFVGEPLKVARDQQGRNKNDELNLLHRRSGSGQKGSVEHHPAIRDRAPSPGAGSIDAMHFG
jgi:diguanylate cyclase (GGDEF)-like protein